MRDSIEELIDRFEKVTDKGEILPLEKYKESLKKFPLITKGKLPSDAMVKAIYHSWVGLRKKAGNALMRIFMKKPDLNDNSPIASFRSRIPEKMQTRRKNKNDKNNYMKLKLLRKEIFCGRSLIIDVMKREKLKMTSIELDFMEIKQKIEEEKNPSYQNPEFREFIQNEEERMMIDLLPEMVEPFRPEEEEEEQNELKPRKDYDLDNLRSGKGHKKKSKAGSDIDHKSNLEPENSINSDFPNNGELPMTRAPISTPNFSQKAMGVPHKPPKDMKAKIDPTTVMQLSIMYRKLNYIGIQVDRNRIKISSSKAIKKEDLLNLSQKEIEKELYFRSGTRPSSMKLNNDSTGKMKYTVFQARNKRVLILRKPEGGRYEVFNKRNYSQFERVKPETANHIKRIKLTENDEFEGIRHSVSPAIPICIQHDIKQTFGDCYDIDNIKAHDSDESMQEDDTKEEEDDYIAGFIERYRKRRGNKRPNGNVISVRV